MIYELRIDTFFESLDPINDLMEHLNRAKPEMKIVNPGQPDQECSFIDLIENRHDENPHAPCTELSHWDNCPLAP